MERAQTTMHPSSICAAGSAMLAASIALFTLAGGLANAMTPIDIETEKSVLSHAAMHGCANSFR